MRKTNKTFSPMFVSFFGISRRHRDLNGEMSRSFRKGYLASILNTVSWKICCLTSETEKGRFTSR